MDLEEFRRKMRDLGLSEHDIDDIVGHSEKNIQMLTFCLDSTGTKVVSYYRSTIVFVSNKYPGTVNLGETWICSLEEKNRSYHAMPLYKVTPTLLLSLSPEMRTELIDSLWKKNREMFESEFAGRYKEEVHNKAIDEVRNEMQSIIDGLKGQVADLQSQLEQNRILSQSSAARSEPEMIELGSDIVGEIELSSEIPSSVSAEVRSEMPPAIPNTYRTPVPGMPEIRIGESRSMPSAHIIYDVTRTGEETLFSESFTDDRYFVHISPDCRLLVIRPNRFGSALCMNRRIRLKGLGRLNPFTEKKKLMAEYSDKYEGMIVYL